MKHFKTKTGLVVFVLMACAVIFGLPGAKHTHPPEESPPATVGVEERQLVSASHTMSLARAGDDDSADSPQIAASRILTDHPGYIDYRYYLLQTPNDPAYSSNWANQTIQANRAWDMTTGSADTVIAVIDSPFALNHQDLATRWHINAGETGVTQPDDPCWTGMPEDKAANNCDDDGNGFVDDWRGFDFFNWDNNVQAGLTNPNGEGVDHGTLVAGVIAAQANNNLGGAGVDWSASVMPLQVFSDDGEAYTTHVVAAIEYAVDNGADIINLSLGTNGADSAMLAAVQYARNNDVLVVAASGNCVGSSDSFCTSLPDVGRMLYPAKFAGVVAVGASTQADARAGFSSYGSELDVIAPGVGVGLLPTYTAGNATSAYATASGTSFAAPVTAGVAGLLLAQNPHLTVAELETILRESSEKVSAMSSTYRTNQHGYGRLNAHRAVLMAEVYRTQEAALGSGSLSHREPPAGAIWRAYGGNVASDEWILIGCRVAPSKTCSATIQNGSIYRFTPALVGKSTEVQYIYVRGNAVPVGTWTLAVHNDQLASTIGILQR